MCHGPWNDVKHSGDMAWEALRVADRRFHQEKISEALICARAAVRYATEFARRLEEYKDRFGERDA